MKSVIALMLLKAGAPSRGLADGDQASIFLQPAAIFFGSVPAILENSTAVTYATTFMPAGVCTGTNQPSYDVFVWVEAM